MRKVIEATLISLDGVVEGNTATLSPSPQTCTNPVVGQFSISAWTVTSTDAVGAAESVQRILHASRNRARARAGVIPKAPTKARWK